LRHTFRTVADATRDFPACRAVMGHADNSMDAAYTESIDDSRLVAVVDHVRQWLFGVEITH
jgi:integrase